MKATKFIVIVEYNYYRKRDNVGIYIDNRITSTAILSTREDAEEYKNHILATWPEDTKDCIRVSVYESVEGELKDFIKN